MSINDLFATKQEKNILTKLVTISHLTKDNAVAPVVMDYYALSEEYKVGDDIILQYLTYKHTTPDKAKSFVSWYTSSEYFKKPISWHDKDIYQHQLGTAPVDQINKDLHHIAQENKVRRYQHGCM